jgi:DNA-binding LacI/PurR family transcriptional regulator
MMLFQVMADGTIEDVVPDMIQYRLSGCIVIPAVAMTPGSAEKLQNFGTTVVMMNRAPVGGACAIRQDQVKGAHAVAEFFSMAGHERIALIAGNQNPAAIDREHGFREGLAACGKSLYAREEGLFTFRDAYNAASTLFDMRRPPDAIFAANDMMALATLEAARIKGVTIPGDVSVIGYDNGRVGAWPGFRLTTVEQPIELMFESALQIILARSADETLLPEIIEVQPRLIIRDSARLPQELHNLSIGYRYAEPTLPS